ncbi:hypothetical protein IGI04_035679 [Brassica rapa subsp. trilocularis]|uniref:Uncharacterized protein n=1 Tax=Brassica rapa subsp. trilocularis TaxID=1813537 RepID=A0ABQ7LF81_BRACM|nr:hypothetical protein IGI04_035679 [Brassica rapa subsp. trilocularis]
MANTSAGRYCSTVEVWLLTFWVARKIRHSGELMEVDMLLLDAKIISIFNLIIIKHITGSLCDMLFIATSHSPTKSPFFSQDVKWMSIKSADKFDFILATFKISPIYFLMFLELLSVMVWRAT